MRIENKHGGYPILWCGVDTIAWFDLGGFFSIDIGTFFLRLFFRIGKFRFCRYLGVIV